MGETSTPRKPAPTPGVSVKSLEQKIAHIDQSAEPFTSIDSAPLGRLLHDIGDARVVLIGEASHGTSEFYCMRQRITQALIRRHNFSIVAAEADWPDAEHIDAYVRHRGPKQDGSSDPFGRFPTWMWRNHEVLEFMEWLRAYNDHQNSTRQKVGFYGLDLYSLYTSIQEVVNYLNTVDPELAELAQNRYECLEPFEKDPQQYARAVTTSQYEDCEEDVVQMLGSLFQNRLRYTSRDGDRFFNALQNARVVKGAEQYYRHMFYGSTNTWNLRDEHMFETLRSLLEFKGPQSRAVVWAHNSHIGRAGATYMAKRDQTNLGELARQKFGDAAYLIGFGTDHGTVAAASGWDRPVEIQNVRPAPPETYEHLFHTSSHKQFFLHLRRPAHEALREALKGPQLERAIGVIYRPETELQSHYFEADLPEQFDEYIWIDESRAVRPFERTKAPSLPENHPFLTVD